MIVWFNGSSEQWAFVFGIKVCRTNELLVQWDYINTKSGEQTTEQAITMVKRASQNLTNHESALSGFSWLHKRFVPV